MTTTVDNEIKGINDESSNDRLEQLEVLSQVIKPYVSRYCYV